jgi:riboflavin synthase
MFTGIIESLGKVARLDFNQENLDLTIESELSNELKVDQSVAHNGVCLTVTGIHENQYQVTAIKETLEKSNLSQLQEGNLINIERCLQYGGRIDGHIVQGHVDTMGELTQLKNEEGSWKFKFSYPTEFANMLVNKGSITVNGVSLTVVDPSDKDFSVAIIPYTYENTVFHQLNKGDKVNLEFDILGKYVARQLSIRK